MTTEASEKDDWQGALERALGGDLSALGKLCHMYVQPKAYRFAISLLRSHEDAEDVLQDVFYRLIKGYQGIRNRSLESFEALVITMTKNACYDLLRKRQIGHKYSDQMIGGFSSPRGMQERIWEFVYTQVRSELGEEAWKIFEMKVIQGFTYKDIHIQTEIPISTLESQVKIILKTIRENKKLRPYWEDYLFRFERSRPQRGKKLKEVNYHG